VGEGISNPKSEIRNPKKAQSEKEESSNILFDFQDFFI